MAIKIIEGGVSSPAFSTAEITTDPAVIEEAIAGYVLCALSGNCSISDRHQGVIDYLKKRLEELKRE